MLVHKDEQFLTNLFHLYIDHQYINNQNQQINEDSKDEDMKENGDINVQEQSDEFLRKFEDEENMNDEIKKSNFQNQ